MSVGAPTLLPSCHASHLFNAPFCKDLSLVRRVAHLFFHVFTLGIPLTIHYIAIHCFPKKAPAQEEAKVDPVMVADLKTKARQVQLGEEALQFARAELAKNPQLKPDREFDGACNYILSHEIGCLRALVLMRGDAMDTNFPSQNKHSWDMEAFLKEVDATQKLAYAVSVLALQDLKGRATALIDLIEKKDPGAKLCFMLPIGYHATAARENSPIYPNQADIDAHIQKYYQMETSQHNWRDLYNYYCEQFGQVINRQQLKEISEDHFAWTEKDTGINTFVPKALP